MPSNRDIPGLDFGLGEEIDMLRETVRGFSDAKVAPIAAEIDRSDEFPRHLWPEMGALGLHGITATRSGAAPAWATSPTASPWRR
jgi:isovaleryl-CoA dehydrogenase